jgi:hypothetical protein
VSIPSARFNLCFGLSFLLPFPFHGRRCFQISFSFFVSFVNNSCVQTGQETGLKDRSHCEEPLSVHHQNIVQWFSLVRFAPGSRLQLILLFLVTKTCSFDDNLYPALTSKVIATSCHMAMAIAASTACTIDSSTICSIHSHTACTNSPGEPIAPFRDWASGLSGRQSLCSLTSSFGVVCGRAERSMTTDRTRCVTVPRNNAS